MLHFAYRQLLHEPGRSLLTALAIAAVLGTILVLEGFRTGLLEQMRRAVLNRGAELIVTQAGVSNLLAARSILPQLARSQVEDVPGVVAAHPLTGIPVIYGRNGERAPLLMLVYDTLGGPEVLAAGRRPSAPREVVVDRSIAARFGLAPGDPFIVADFEFRISGISRGAAAFFTAFAFVRYDDLIDFYLESDVAADITAFPLLSFLLVELDPGADPAGVADAIEAAVPAGDVYSPQALAAEDEALGRALFGPILGLLIAIAYLVGLLVMAIIMFAAVNARRRQLGILKALGFGPGFVAGTVVAEALLLTLLAIPLGMALAGGVAVAIEHVAPVYLVLPFDLLPQLRTVVAGVGFILLGALIPVRVVARLDPALVFEA